MQKYVSSQLVYSHARDCKFIKVYNPPENVLNFKANVSSVTVQNHLDPWIMKGSSSFSKVNKLYKYQSEWRDIDNTGPSVGCDL